MSQTDCEKILAKYPNKWFTTKEIQKKLKNKISKVSITRNMKQMRKSCRVHIRTKKYRNGVIIYYYRHKRRK